VCDLEVTVVDSETRSHESWRHVFRSRGIVPEDDLIRAFVGRRGVDVHDLLRERVPEHDPAELMAASSAHFHAPHQPPLGLKRARSSWSGDQRGRPAGPEPRRAAITRNNPTEPCARCSRWW
jgi:beta-phosphoglucomutase-like phosphatase (HAD superfamily)